jgi:26S proteasome regulatory subunit N2
VTTEKAPVAGQTNAGGSSNLTPRQQHNILSQAIRASAGGDLRSLNEINEFLSRSRAAHNIMSRNSPPETGSGAAAAAGVLTAVDEDGEGDEEAEPPRVFDYYSDAETDQEDA